MNTTKEKRAIEYLKSFEPKREPYYLCYSGGKDSDCILALARLAGVNFEAVHNLTTVDAPETVHYVQQQKDVHIDYPHTSMWELIVKQKYPPIRTERYCCKYLKEDNGRGRVKITGVRWAESARRKDNQGLVTVIGKPATTQKAAQEIGANFMSTPKGGGSERR